MSDTDDIYASLPENATARKRLGVAVRKAAKVTVETLEQDFSSLPGDIAYMAAHYGEACRRAILAKAYRERVFHHALSDPDVLSACEERVGKRPNLDQLKGFVLASDEYVEAKEAEAAAESHKVYMRGVMEALSTKRDTLVSLAAQQRVEMHHDPVLRERHATDRRATYGTGADGD